MTYDRATTRSATCKHRACDRKSWPRVLSPKGGGKVCAAELHVGGMTLRERGARGFVRGLGLATCPDCDSLRACPKEENCDVRVVLLAHAQRQEGHHPA